MKGSPKLPSCGFSAQESRRLPHVANVLPMLIFCRIGHSCGTAEICELADLPATVGDGELVGGCDIVIEMYQRGERSS